MSIPSQSIVLGVGRSADADAALRWALREGQRRRAPVHLIRAYPSPLPYQWDVTYMDMPDPHYRFVRRSAEKLLTATVAAASRIAPDVEVTSAAMESNTSRILVDASRNAALVVLGSRGVTGVGSLLLGSVGIAVTARAGCPVVVARASSEPLRDRASVVVGVDGTDDADATFGFAFDHASRRGVPLRAVLCWDPDTLVGARRQLRQSPHARAAAWLESMVARWRDKYPDVRAHGDVVPDQPVGGLLEASAGHRLLVVGNRSTDAVAGTLVGSVAQGVLHGATCPVAVIPVGSI